MRNVVLGLFLAVGLAGAAQAGDYVVVSSTEEALTRGTELNSGQRIALPAGKTVTLMYVSGDITTLRGGASGATVPTRGSAAPDAQRMASLKALVAPPVAGRTFGGRRSGVCPDPATLRTLEQMIAVQNAGCRQQAQEALEAYLTAQGAP